MAPRRRLEPLARAVLRSQPDDRLVALAREGREPAFEEIVRRYRPGLVAFATAFAPPGRAEDVVQESLLRSWTALKESESEIHLRPWLYTIVRNRALNARRDARPAEPLDESTGALRQPADFALEREELARVVAAVQALPASQREALVRSSLDGHTHEQIAGALGTSPGGVRQLVFRARASVRHAVGLAVPLPLVRALSETGTADAAAAAAGGGALAAGSLGAGGGTSVAAKLAAIGAIGAVAAGSGVAIKRAADGNDARGAEAREAQATGEDRADAARESRDDASAPGGGSSEGPGSGPGGNARGEEDSGSEREGRDDDGGESDRGDGSGDESGPGAGSSGSSGPGSSEPRDDGSGPSASSGPGSGDEDGSGGHSGSGSSGSGSGHSGEDDLGDDSSGPGSGDEPDFDDSAFEPEEPDDDAGGNSGPGSGSSGSGDD